MEKVGGQQEFLNVDVEGSKVKNKDIVKKRGGGRRNLGQKQETKNTS